MNAVAEWLAAVTGSVGTLGAWIVWIALLLALGALPSLLPRRATDRSPRTVLAMWAGLLAAAMIVARGDSLLAALDRASQAVARSARSRSGQLDPVLSRLPEEASAWLSQLPWIEIGVATFLLGLVLAFYLPRHSRFGHER